MEIIEEIQGDIKIFRVNGHLDSNTSQLLEDKLFETISDGSKRIIIDFNDLNYISSAGLRVMLTATKVIKREGGQIMLCCMQEFVKEVFEIAGLGSLLRIAGTMEEALKAF